MGDKGMPLKLQRKRHMNKAIISTKQEHDIPELESPRPNLAMAGAAGGWRGGGPPPPPPPPTRLAAAGSQFFVNPKR